MLKIMNTMSAQKEHFVPKKPSQVSMYVCGITPYAPSHIGHGRCYVVFDVWYRLLSFLGYDVIYCRNFTDIEDKLLHKAEQEYGDQYRYKEIADKNIVAYHANMSALNCRAPHYEPRVTDHIPEIIAFIERLIEEDKAYVVAGDVYYHIASFEQYGKLSKHCVTDLRAGSRVSVDEKKRDPLDFALWKSEKEGTFWQSPWGYGRPGWHIECSALALRYLGEQIDIHGGGLDLVFPHHENEIAQSEGVYKNTFAQYWIHNGFVCVNTEKMSKSLNNFFTLDAIFAQFDPMLIRFYFLNHNYRTPINFSIEDITMLQKSYNRLGKLFALSNNKESGIQETPLVKRMLDFLMDDMNVVGMFGCLFEHMHELSESPTELAAVKNFLSEVLGLTFVYKEKEEIITSEIQQLIDERIKARAEKDWARADAIRDQLSALGYQVQDKKLD